MLFSLLPWILGAVPAEVDPYHAGLTAYRAGDLTTAQAHFERVVERFPVQTEFHQSALYNLGRVTAKQGRPCRAKTWLERFLVAAEGSEFAGVGQVRKARARHEEAAQECLAARAPPLPSPVPSRWVAWCGVGEAVVLDDGARVGAVDVEIGGGWLWDGWQAEVGAGIGLGPHLPVQVRPGITLPGARLRLRAGAQILLRPVVAVGALVAPGYVLVDGEGWGLDAAVELGWWPGGQVVTLGGRVVGRFVF